jgi:hypothetical protein
MVNCGGAKRGDRTKLMAVCALIKGSPRKKNRAVPSGPARLKSHVTHAAALAPKRDQLGLVGQDEHAALGDHGGDVDRGAEVLR